MEGFLLPNESLKIVAAPTTFLGLAAKARVFLQWHPWDLWFARIDGNSGDRHPHV
jgi:hypothetical protein